ncbi:MAG TPA: MerR family DNA-binding transcriptional regulator [Candidatus Binatia bacterium]|nr:MerR family DNA-binding transcriptional regulator [Candidatus Binatia bacterium]
MVGLIIFCFGLLFLLLSASSFMQGVQDPSVWVVFSLGLVSVFAGDQIYRCTKRRFINKRQVAELFGVSQRTVDRWLEDGKLPKPKRTFVSAKWNYDELAARLKFKSPN